VIKQYVENQRTPTSWAPPELALSISGLNPEAFRANLGKFMPTRNSSSL
jgi:hypothetical protein